MKTQNQPSTLADFIRFKQAEDQRLRELDAQTILVLKRGLARGAKNFAAGSAALGDVVNMAINPIWTRLGGEELGMPSEFIRKSFDQATGGLTKPQGFGERAQDTAMEFATPGGPAKLAKLAPKNLREVFSAASAGGGLEAARELYPDNPLIQLPASIAASFVPGGIAKAGKIITNVQPKIAPTPKQGALNNYTNFDLNEAMPAKQAAERLGFNLRPAESTANPFVVAHEAQSGVHPQTSAALYQANKAREPKIANAIEDLYETIAPKGATKAEKLYSQAESVLLPDKNYVKLIEEEPVIAKALQKVLKAPEYQTELKGFQSSSTKVLDLVKRNLDDQIATAKKNDKKNKARLLTKAKNKLVDEIDAVNPTYKEARAESMKDIIRNKIEEKVGSTNKGGANFYNKVLKDDKSFKQIYRGLESNPEAQRRLTDMRLAFKNLIEPISSKQASAQAKLAPKTSGPLKFTKDLAHKITNGVYDKAAVDLILDPQWDTRLKTINRIKNVPEKAKEFESLFNDVLQAGAHANKAPNRKDSEISDEELNQLYEQTLAQPKQITPETISDEELDALYRQILK